MPELLDLIVSTLPLATAPAAGDYTVVVQGGVLKKQAPVFAFQGSVGGSPVTIDMGASGITGSFLFNISPASGCTIKVETSRNSGGSYQTVGTFGTDQSIQYTKGSADVNYVTHVRLTRMTGALSTSTYTCTAGYVAFTGPQVDMIGVLQTKVLVVDGVTFIKSVDPVNDRGFISQSFGVSNNIMQIENYATSGYSWDYSRGDVWFGYERCSSAPVFVNAPATGNNDLGTVANQAARLALSAAVVNDACYQTDTALYYVLTTAGPSVNGHWTALPAGTTSGIVQVLNPCGLEDIQNGPVRGYKSRAVNIWTKQ